MRFVSSWRSGSLLLLGLLAACQSSRPRPAGEPLPFHVALLPTEMLDTSAGGRPEDAGGMRLALTGAEISNALRDELARAFARATVLELPLDPVGLAALAPAEREDLWQECARAAGADLLVRPRLLFDPAIDGERNEKFWLNLPLFLLGGPMCYFVGDRTYALTARLQVEVFDTSVGHESLAAFALLPLPLQAEFEGVDLRFIDRADGVTDYALSLLVPAGLLAREGDEIAGELGRRLPAELGRELATKVLAGRSQLEQNPAIGCFELEAGAIRLEPGAMGRTRVRVPVRELGEGAVPSRYEIRAGGVLLARGALETASPSGGRHLIEAELELPPGTDFLRVSVADTLANTRSYTLPLAPPRE